MSLRNKVKAVFTVLAILLGVGTGAALTAGPARAATPSCGPSCVDLFNRDLGTHQTPAFVLDVLRQGERVNQPAILFRTSNSDLAEDFKVEFAGKVSDFYAAGLVSSLVNLHYGCGFNPLTGLCSTTVNPFTGLPFPDDYAFEIEYAPYGVDSGLCLGVASTAFSGEGVTLQLCGTSSRTVWVIDQADSSTGQLRPLLFEYVPLINGSTVNFSDPQVLTYPSGAFPTDKPRVQIVTEALTGFTNPGTGDPAGVDSSQLWGADIGVLK